MREDLAMITTMKANGFDVVVSPMDILYKRETPNHPVAFVKGTLHVWKCKTHWMTADLIDGYYCNHKPVNELTDLLISK
jgi:hypothetical protein